jgi:hypothetical protein
MCLLYCAWNLPVCVSAVTSGSRPVQRTVAAGSTDTAGALDPDTGYCCAGAAAGDVVVVRWVYALL